MFRLLLSYAFIVVSIASGVPQYSPGSHVDNNDPSAAYGVEITAKVVLEDGSPIATNPLISSNSCGRAELFRGGTLRLYIPPGGYIFNGAVQTQGCYLTITLQGYRSFTGWVRDGTLVTLHRIGANEGSSVSVVSLNAPPDAKARYQAGEAAAAKKRWPQAEQAFRDAVSIYPNYALAWSELGQVLIEQNRLDEATSALTKSHDADPQYIKPLVQLLAVASLQQRWADELRLGQTVLPMRPVEFPAAFFYYAEAVFHTGKLDDAELLARKAIQFDPAGTCPQSLLLLGAIFEKQGNVHDALAEYKAYLKLFPHGPDSQQAKDAVARLKHG